MTQVMAQLAPGLTAPSSRQDVISALLNDYGNSFGRDEESPSQYSPVSVFKELPPPPPSKDEKLLPAQPLMMRFQLRVDEPNSPTTSYGFSPSDSGSPPTRIVSKSISRKSKPPSLRLTASNGSTDKVVVSPRPPSVPAKEDPFRDPETASAAEERPLPPPPPAKSERRLSQRKQQERMGAKASRLERKDSKDPQDANVAWQEQGDGAQATQPVKRKPVPGAVRTLADLQGGPRGRSVAPKPTTSTVENAPSLQGNARRPSLPTTSSPEAVRRPSIPTSTSSQESTRRPSIPSTSQEHTRLPSLPRSSSSEAQSRDALSGHRPTFSKISIPAQVPPTPDEQPPPQPPAYSSKPNVKEPPLPPPPKKVFVGLPSNPRVKAPETPKSPKHIRGKSSTGFDALKGAGFDTTPPPLTTNLNTITPGPTPSPGKTEDAAQVRSLAGAVRSALKGPESPVSPLEDDARRPFSFEAPPPQTRNEQQQQQRQQPASSISPPANSQPFPPRTTSRPDTQPAPFEPGAFPQHPGQAEAEEKPFVPLTRSPLSMPARPITNKHMTCYTRHASFSRYTSRFQTTGCMVCAQSEPGNKYACVWCMLQVCEGCWDELQRTPGKDVARLIAKHGVATQSIKSETERERERDANMPSVVVWEAEEQDDS